MKVIAIQFVTWQTRDGYEGIYDVKEVSVPEIQKKLMSGRLNACADWLASEAIDAVAKGHKVTIEPVFEE